MIPAGISAPLPAGVAEEPDVVELRGQRGWCLRQNWSYQDGPSAIRIPAGFICDLASVPRAVWAVLSPADLSESAALVHDWIYRHAGTLPGGLSYTRAESDRLFFRIMGEEGVSSWKRRAAYVAVRLFGHSAWRVW